MSVEHILTEIVNRPLFITADKLNVIMGGLNKKSDHPVNLDLSSLVPVIGSDKDKGAVEASARPINSAGKSTSIAVIDALGSLVSRNHGFSDGSGLRSYRYMQKNIQAALHNPEIGGMIIDFDSYGGTAAGCERLARFIKEADAKKPIYALVDLNCFSAGYYLASACRKIILADQDAGVGSIGCIAIHKDQSKKNEQDGVVYTAVYFGAEKNNFSPHAPFSIELKKKLNFGVSKAGMQFSKTVGEFQGLELDKVLAMNAGVLYGQDAIEAGLADEIAIFDDAVAMLAADIEEHGKSSTSRLGSGFNSVPEKSQNNTDGGPEMDTRERMAALLAGDDGPAAIAELGYVKNEELQTAVAAAVEEGKAQLVANHNVAELCQLGGLTLAESMPLLKENLTEREARESVQKIKAKKTDEITTTSTLSPLSGEGKHGLIASAEELAVRK